MTDTADQNSPDGASEPVLWEWIPFGNDETVRKPIPVIAWTVIGLLFLIMGVNQYVASLDPNCATRYCRGGEIKGLLSSLAGLHCLAFPWLSKSWRGYLASYNKLTPSYFSRETLGKTKRFYLSTGSIQIRNNMAYFVPPHGRRHRLTGIMSTAEAKRLFAAVQEARRLQANSQRDSE